MTAQRPHLLPRRPAVRGDLLDRVRGDFERFSQSGLPADFEHYLQEAYRIDVTASYAGIPLKNPWGKASGQLSLNVSQIEEAVREGLGFVVLKTVIAEDSGGNRSMGAWAIREARMLAEPIIGRESGESGWTISWKGRGWWQTFQDYLNLVREGVSLGRSANMPVIPSVKYHLPSPDESEWRIDEYTSTTRSLLQAFQAGGSDLPMPLEKDFSPTLAGSDRAAQRARILEWIRKVPELVRKAAGPDAVKIGLKLFNSLDDDAFQLAMLGEAHGTDRADFLIYANRLFDPDRAFDGHRGIAYGGPDLSDRNLRLLSALRKGQALGQLPATPLEISATGDIGSGRMAVEYALRGCTSFQIHTAFQLPAETYVMKSGTKLQRALHQLYLDPDDGFVVWLLHAAQALGVADRPMVRFLDVAAEGNRHLGMIDGSSGLSERIAQ